MFDRPRRADTCTIRTAKSLRLRDIYNTFTYVTGIGACEDANSEPSPSIAWVHVEDAATPTVTREERWLLENWTR